MCGMVMSSTIAAIKWSRQTNEALRCLGTTQALSGKFTLRNTLKVGLSHLDHTFKLDMDSSLIFLQIPSLHQIPIYVTAGWVASLVNTYTHTEDLNGSVTHVTIF